MNSTLLKLPIELQRKILEQLYEPWHLQLEEVPARSRYPLYSIAISHKLQTSTLRVCRLLREITREIINESFTGVLDARSAPNQLHSLMPKYKGYLHRVKIVKFATIHAFTTTGQLYYSRLEALKVFEVAHKMKVIGDAINGIELYPGESLVWFANQDRTDDEYKQTYLDRLSLGMAQDHEWQWALQSQFPITVKWSEELSLANGIVVTVTFRFDLSIQDTLCLSEFEVIRQGFNAELPTRVSALALS